MKTRTLGLVLLLAATTVLAQPAPPEGDGPWVVRATFQTRSQVDFLAAEIEPWEVHHGEGWLVVDVDRAGWQLLLDLGMVPELDEARTAKYRAPHVMLPEQIEGIPSYPCYRTVEETFAAALALVAAHPTLATWTDIGNSWEKADGGGPPGYDMMVLTLTNSATPGPKPKVLMFASIHAREYVTAELATRLAEHLLSNYGTDPDVTWFLDHQEVHLVLHTNPDGRKKAETGADWRKNTNSGYCTTPSSYGIDLNRNFPYNWGCCGGSSGSPCSGTYRGPSPVSEPETIAVRDYALAIFPDYGDPQVAPIPDDAAGVFIDLHSYGELVLWPWGYTYSAPPNASGLRTFGRKLAYFNGHEPDQSCGLYLTDGTTDDFTYGELGVASYTFEMGDDFFQDCTTFTSTILPTNLQALLYAIRVARLPYRLPAGPDALSVATTPSGNVTAGTDVLVTATINDTRYNNTNGTEPVQAIAAAEVYVDTPPWATGATPVALTATDGTFNATVEAVQGTLATAAWTGTNPHTLYVRGRDAGNTWGPVSAVFVRLVGPGNETLTVSKPGSGSGTVTSS
ncbi:MAG: peptidase M14, partial [Acidobacteria bacterium]|nr:peptidase M14 [Acidobacteriota bacterium]